MLSEVKVGECFVYGDPQMVTKQVFDDRENWLKTEAYNLRTGRRSTWSSYIYNKAPSHSKVEFRFEKGRSLGTAVFNNLKLGDSCGAHFIKVGSDQILDVLSGKLSQPPENWLCNRYESKIYVERD